MGSLDGKIAVVTGAGKNIGRAIALTLARDGAAVVVNGRGDQAAVDAVAEEITSAGGRAFGHLADVGDEAAVAAMVERAVETFGRIDIVVSNAGLRRQTPFLEMGFAEWREILSVALDGAFILTRACAPHMIARSKQGGEQGGEQDGGGGAIVGLSGVSTHVGTPERCHVSASKSGLEGLMRALAVELGPHGITANCVSPGAIDTVRGAAAGRMPSTMRAAGVPAGRKGTVGEIAAMVHHLVGPQGRFITGQTIHVNGGAFLT
ncbi:SDR family NAD(P)-dependent oxidoreductase [Thalassobaculum sp.]|uniref:SDR family NAD(P)-dependent oxidoreductase n=1 Tax=Thalassobaculum sp. TaxID=2022740 RepID=UPI0032F066A5